MIHQVRVIFGDTDQMGVVYYANYLRYFEASRAALLRNLGKNQRDLENWGMALPVVDVYCKYRRPAHYEDLLDVHVHLDQIKGASLRFVYEIRRDDRLLTDGYSRHACVDNNGRPRRLPQEFVDLVSNV